MDEHIRFPSIQLLRALPSAGPVACGLFLAQAVGAGLAAPLTAIASGALIAALTDHAAARAVAAAAVVGGLFVLGPALGAFQSVLGSRLGSRLSHQFRDR